MNICAKWVQGDVMVITATAITTAPVTTTRIIDGVDGDDTLEVGT